MTEPDTGPGSLTACVQHLDTPTAVAVLDQLVLLMKVEGTNTDEAAAASFRLANQLLTDDDADPDLAEAWLRLHVWCGAQVQSRHDAPRVIAEAERLLTEGDGSS
jgi:hypothetical protein